MQIVRTIATHDTALRGASAAIGNFDGVNLVDVIEYRIEFRLHAFSLRIGQFDPGK